MRSRVSISCQISRHYRDLRNPPNLVPALRPRHLPSEKVDSCSKQRGGSVTRRRRQPQKWSDNGISFIEIRQHGFGRLHVQPGGCVNSRGQYPIRFRKRRLHRPAQLAVRQRRQRYPTGNPPVRRRRFGQTHRNNLRVCRRQQHREKHKHPKYCDPAHRPLRVIFMQCTLHALFPPARSSTISSRRRFCWQR
jgi:hypothetical protein